MERAIKWVEERFIQSVFPAIRAGMTGKPEILTTGGDQAVGSILFAGQPTAEDTITLNGTVWTFKDSGASGAQTDIGASLADTLAALVIDLNGSADAEVAKVTWTEDDTSLIATYDADGVAGNSYTLAASITAGSTITAMAGGEAAGVISLDTEYTDFAIANGQEQDQAFTLADGDEGQKKCLFLSTKQDGNVVVTPANLHGGTTITFDAEKEVSELRFVGSGWKQTGGDATVG